MPLSRLTIAIIGSGNMGEALIHGLLAASAVTPAQLVATDVHIERRQLVTARYGVRTTSDNLEAISRADVVVLAVKPQQMTPVLEGLRAGVTPEKLVVSIAAGVRTSRIERELGDGVRVVRVMPNTPAQIRAGAAALARGQHASESDLEIAEAILKATGITVRTEEEALDAVTALSGSGPAYVFLLAEAMIQSGVEIGLGHELSHKLAVQTILGAAKLLAESDEHPEVLRRRVTSPGGTTEAAMKVMKEGRLVEVFVDAVKAAARRSAELSTT